MQVMQCTTVMRTSNSNIIISYINIFETLKEQQKLIMTQK